jgi:hypothetical protein
LYLLCLLKERSYYLETLPRETAHRRYREQDFWVGVVSLVTTPDLPPACPAGGGDLA